MRVISPCLPLKLVLTRTTWHFLFKKIELAPRINKARLIKELPDRLDIGSLTAADRIVPSMMCEIIGHSQFEQINSGV